VLEHAAYETAGELDHLRGRPFLDRVVVENFLGIVLGLVLKLEEDLEGQLTGLVAAARLANR
jgi:hypothetical protein